MYVATVHGAPQNSRTEKDVDDLLSSGKIADALQMSVLLRIGALRLSHDVGESGRQDLLFDSVRRLQKWDEPVRHGVAGPLVEMTWKKVRDRFEKIAPGHELAVTGFETVAQDTPSDAALADIAASKPADGTRGFWSRHFQAWPTDTCASPTR
ncbi:hypothetical protein HFO17_25205 [Rhizobium laguerreae]|uniref:hypothetical protein n=1 Tax=Rhizobium laguerreae TaxID=1076926 RepID=UPI001C92738E|nr:hypothetical protein [Rhizobium laguerreae]MBY3237797.1 hypothetical protein [Rhizobium laguerreae]